MAKSKITKAKVKKLKADIVAGVKQTELAQKYKISRSLVSEIANERAHKDVPWPEGKPTPKKAGGQRKEIENYDPTDRKIQIMNRVYATNVQRLTNEIIELKMKLDQHHPQEKEGRTPQEETAFFKLILISLAVGFALGLIVQIFS